MDLYAYFAYVKIALDSTITATLLAVCVLVGIFESPRFCKRPAVIAKKPPRVLTSTERAFCEILNSFVWSIDSEEFKGYQQLITGEKPCSAAEIHRAIALLAAALVESKDPVFHEFDQNTGCAILLQALNQRRIDLEFDSSITEHYLTDRIMQAREYWRTKVKQ